MSARKRILCMCEMACLALVACDDDGFPGEPPPGACQAEERVCYHEPNSGREYVLRCNMDANVAAIWIIQEVCVDGATCDVDRCVPAGGTP